MKDLFLYSLFDKPAYKDYIESINPKGVYNCKQREEGIYMAKKIAIPTEGDIVNAHFGRSQAFTVFEIKNGQVLNEELIDTRGFEHQHAGIAQLLKSKDTETVICGGIGPGAIQGLESEGLEVLRGASGLVRDVAKAYANGTFIGTEAVCDHSHDHHDMHKH